MRFGFQKINKFGERGEVIEIAFENLPLDLDEILPAHIEEEVELRVFQISD
jgi:hypothetical protein